MAIIKTPAAVDSPYQTTDTAPTVLRASADGTTVLAAATTTTTSTAAADANANVSYYATGVEGIAGLANQGRVFDGANVYVTLDQQNFNTTNKIDNPAGSNGYVQFNNGGILGGSANLAFDGANLLTGGIKTDNYYYANGSPFSGGGGSSYGNANVVALLSAFGSNTLFTTGNVTAGYILGNGSQLTGLPATYGNANVVANLAALGPNPVSTTGNITAGYILGNGSQLTGITVNTGNVTFDDINIIGTGNLHLQPDPENSGAYLDIYLTAGPDIHIAGNGENLILGRDEGANVTVDAYGNVSVQTWDGTANVWTFGSDGVLTTPGVSGNITGANVISANTFAITGNTVLGQIEGANTVGFYNPSASTVFLIEMGPSNTWGFNGNTGGTGFPQLSVQRGDNPSGTITGQTLLFGDPTQEAIISTPDGDSNYNNSQRLVINPGAGAANTAGEGGDIYLWAGRGGNASGSGGDIKIRGGAGGDGTSGGNGGAGGYIRIEAGDGYTTNTPGGVAGFIELTSGVGGENQQGGYINILAGTGGSDANAGPGGGDANITGGPGRVNGLGGNVNITGGSAQGGLAYYGNVNIAAGASTWTFDKTGNLTAPGVVTAITLSAVGNLVANNAMITQQISGGNLDIVGTGNVGNLSTVGTVSANGNITTLSSFYAGNGATWQSEASYANVLFVGADVGEAYVQAAIVNTGGNGSSDWVSYANNGNTDQGWVDMGITGNTFSDPDYTITDPNDGYILVQGTNISGTPLGGNLILATGTTGLAHDIVFATGGFTHANIKARIVDATGEFSVVGNILSNGIVKTGVFAASNIPTASSVGAGSRAFVTDADSLTFGNLYVGSAANAMPIWTDGTSWYIG